MYRRFLALAALAGAAAASTACAIFDANFNLLVLGGAQDVSLGAQSGWASASATPISASGRPPFSGGSNVRCHLNQFDNVVLVLGADAANPDAVYIFDPTANAWSMQPVATSGFDVANMVEILDHDTNTFYTLQNGTMWFLSGFDGLKAGKTPALAWQAQNPVAFSAAGYSPTMAIADNHIYFFGAPGAPSDALYIYVIHFAFAQPDPQTYPGASLPASHGQVPSLFKAGGVQELIAYVPDDASAVFVVDVVKNSTTQLPGPSDTSAGAVYSASESALVQLSSAGKLAFLAIDPASGAAQGGWTAMAATVNLAAAAGGAGSSSAGAAGSATAGASASKGATGAGAGTVTGTAGAPAATGTGAGTARAQVCQAVVLLGAVALGAAVLL